MTNLHPHAMRETGSTGATLRAWFIPSTSDAAVGTLNGTFQTAGDAAPSAAFVFKIWNGTALVQMDVQDDVFGLSFAFESQARFNLVVMLKSETQPSNWHSSDDGKTWTRIDRTTPPTPIYSLITGAGGRVVDAGGNRLVLT